MRTENEIRKQLEDLEKQKINGSYSELKGIALHGTIQALRWVLENTEVLLTYKI